MTVFAWRRRPSRHFGDLMVPYAEVDLCAVTGQWQRFSLQVDTGAVVTVLARSAADYLGLELDQGAVIELTSVGGLTRRYFLHTIEARVGDMGPFRARVAVAESAEVPALLGRLDFTDRFQIDLDPSLEETRFSAPWLSPTDELLWRHFIRVQETIVAKWNACPLRGRADEAARRFLNRADQLAAAIAGLVKLHRPFELPLLIRSLFELSIQFEYLLRDPERLAALYLDYEHVTKFRSQDAWQRLPGIVGRRLRESAKVRASEPDNRSAYERVRGAYSRPNDPGRTRNHWYPGTLRHLASALDRTAEYDAIYGLYSAWAHGDPWTAKLIELGHGGLWHALAYWARLLLGVAEVKKIVLSGEDYESLAELAKGLAG